MATNLGQTLGQTYALPTVQPQQPLPQQKYDDGVQAMEGLQYVKGQTEDYYKKVSALKSFMQDVHANYGVDVRVPDLSRPESIKLNQIYNDAIADIMQQGNLLKVSQPLAAMRDQRGVLYSKGVDPTATAAAEMRPGEQFYERSFEPEVGQVNDLTQKQTFDENAQKAAQKVYEDKLAEYDRLIKENPESRDRLEYQKRGLTPPVQHIKQFAPPRDNWQEKRWGRQVDTAGNFLKDITQLQKGTSDSYKLDESVLNPETGSPLYVSSTYQNAAWGANPTTGKAMEIKHWGHDPSTGDTWIFFKDGSKPQKVTKENPLAITRGILSDNGSKFGASAEQVDEYAEKRNIYNTDGSVNANHPILSRIDKKGNNYEQSIIDSRRKEQQGSQSKIQQDALVSELKDFNTNNKSAWLLPNPEKAYTTPNGTPFTVKRKVGGGLYIPEYSDLFTRPADKSKIPAYTQQFAKYGPEGNATPEEMAKLLIRLGVHQTINAQPSGTQVAPTSQDTTITPEQWNAQWAALKPGQSLKGLDGKTYTKK